MEPFLGSLALLKVQQMSKLMMVIQENMDMAKKQPRQPMTLQTRVEKVWVRLQTRRRQAVVRMMVVMLLMTMLPWRLLNSGTAKQTAKVTRRKMQEMLPLTELILRIMLQKKTISNHQAYNQPRINKSIYQFIIRVSLDGTILRKAQLNMCSQMLTKCLCRHIKQLFPQLQQYYVHGLVALACLRTSENMSSYFVWVIEYWICSGRLFVWDFSLGLLEVSPGDLNIEDRRDVA